MTRFYLLFFIVRGAIMRSVVLGLGLFTLLFSSIHVNATPVSADEIQIANNVIERLLASQGDTQADLRILEVNESSDNQIESIKIRSTSKVNKEFAFVELFLNAADKEAIDLSLTVNGFELSEPFPMERALYYVSLLRTALDKETGYSLTTNMSILNENDISFDGELHSTMSDCAVKLLSAHMTGKRDAKEISCQLEAIISSKTEVVELIRSKVTSIFGDLRKNKEPNMEELTILASLIEQRLAAMFASTPAH